MLDLEKYSQWAKSCTLCSYFFCFMGVCWFLMPLVLIVVFNWRRLMLGDTERLWSDLNSAASAFMIAIPWLLAGFLSRISGKRLKELIAEVEEERLESGKTS